MKPRLFVVGPLPPPIGGFSVMTEAVSRFLATDFEIRSFNRSPAQGLRTTWGRVGGAGRALALWLAFLAAVVARGRPAGVYVALSGNLGQWLDLPFLLIARLLRTPILLHHHSFSYLNRPMLSARCCFAAAGARAQHIVLCKRMAEQLVGRYGLGADQLHVVSNATFLTELRDAPTGTGDPHNGGLRLGILGNLTADKGVFRFLDTVERLQAAGIQVDAHVAGPIDESVRSAVELRMRGIDGLHYHGPVYGARKAAFWQSIDVLLFPSSYANEAEPVTILEAFAHNVAVLGTSRGCCSDLLDSQDAHRMQHDEVTFSNSVVAYLVSGGLKFKPKDVKRENVKYFLELQNGGQKSYAKMKLALFASSTDR